MNYYEHNNGRKPWQRESDMIDCPPMMVSEAQTTEDRAAFIWTWSQLVRDDERAALILEAASHG